MYMYFHMSFYPDKIRKKNMNKIWIKPELFIFNLENEVSLRPGTSVVKNIYPNFFCIASNNICFPLIWR